MLRRVFRSAFVGAVLAVAAGCRAKGPAPGAIALQISARHGVGDAAAAAAAAPHVGHSTPKPPLVYADSFVAQGRDTIFLRRARIVLMEMAIAPAVANECEEEEGEDNPPCVEFQEHPRVFEVPLGRGTLTQSAERAPATDYNLFQLVIHKPESEHDTALLRANQDLEGASVRVDGTVSHGGQRHDFVFVSSFEEKEEIALMPVVVVRPGDTLRVTLRIDAASWFTSGDHQSLIDPATAAPGEPNEHTVNDNIRTSLKVFRDANRDGLDDDNEH